MPESLIPSSPLPSHGDDPPRPPRDPRDRGPDVKFPPPLAYVIALGIGALLGRAIPLPWLPDHPLFDALGGTVAIGGLLLVYAGIITFRRARTAIYPNRSAKQVVEVGVYRYTRNPMYVGMTLFHVGVSILFALPWALLLLPLVLVVIVTQVIHREERHLRERFPIEYAAYCARVRRWI